MGARHGPDAFLAGAGAAFAGAALGATFAAALVAVFVTATLVAVTLEPLSGCFFAGVAAEADKNPKKTAVVANNAFLKSLSLAISYCRALTNTRQVKDSLCIIVL